MSSTPESLSAPAPGAPAPGAATGPTRSRRGFRFTAWPLWAVVAGALGAAGTLVFDVRPPAETEAWLAGEDYAVTAADVFTLDVVAGRLGWMAGLGAVFALLIFQGLWRSRVERHFSSAGARVFSGGLLVTAGAAVLGYGWKGALANYLGPESGLYGEDGLFVYYMLTDFGAYLPWFGVLVSAFAVAWMAFVERIVSRILGTVSALTGLFVSGAMFAMGVPGIPGTLMQMWLVVLGVWLAIGRSRITDPEVLR